MGGNRSHVRLIRSASLVGMTGVFVLLVTFLRGIILARVLGPEQFGLTAILITIAAGLDMIIDGGIDQFVVQNRFGQREDVIAAAQYYRFLAAFVFSTLLVVAAPFVADFVSAPHLSSAIQALALISAARSLVNLSYKVEQRVGIYRKESLIDFARFATEIVVLLAAAFSLKSYWALVIAIAANCAVQLVITNFVFASRWYGKQSRRSLRLVGRFSLPISMNSILLFAAMQGDRLVIANALAPLQLATFVAASSFGQAGTGLISRITTSMTLSNFGSGQFRTQGRQGDAIRIHRLFVLGSTVMAVGLALVVPVLVPLAYGSAFAGLHVLIGAIACVNALQVEQGWLTALMTSAGKTRIFPLLTAVRAVSLPLSAVLLAMGQPLVAVSLAAFCGTALAIFPSYWVLLKVGLTSPGNLAIGIIRMGLLLCYLFYTML